MRFDCHFENPTTGERRAVQATLDEIEIADVMRIFADRGPTGPGGPCGPVAKGYALRQAYRQVPDGFLHVDMPQAVLLS
jgi:hypothetical protein